MNLENFIKEKSVLLKTSRRKVEIAPDISEKTLSEWCKKYGKYNLVSEKDGQYSYIILVVSLNSTGSFALTGDSLYFDNFDDSGMQHIKYSEIQRISAQAGSMFATDKIFLHLNNDRNFTLDGAFDGINVERFSDFLTEVIKAANENILTVSSQNIPLYALSDELKLLYLKILCNYCYIDDEQIDSNEYNAVLNFMIRIELNDERRKELREYMNNIGEREKTGVFIQKTRHLLTDETGQWDAFRYSIVQDILYIHNIQNRKKSWREDGFVGSLMKICQLTPEQVDTMVKAVALNQKMQEKDADFTGLKKEWEGFINEIQHTPGYVPTMFLFCSGSVYGIESYTGFLKKDKTNQKAVNKQRELILHEIIINNQKTVNVLIDDLNFIAERLESAAKDAAQSKTVLKNLLLRIKSVSALKDSNEKREADMKELEKSDKTTNDKQIQENTNGKEKE